MTVLNYLLPMPKQIAHLHFFPNVLEKGSIPPGPCGPTASKQKQTTPAGDEGDSYGALSQVTAEMRYPSLYCKK